MATPVVEGLQTGIQMFDAVDRGIGRREDRGRQARQDVLAIDDRNRRMDREDRQDAWALEDRGIRQRREQKTEDRADEVYDRDARKREQEGLLWELRSSLDSKKPVAMGEIVPRLMKAGFTGDQLRRMANPQNQQLAAAMGDILENDRPPTEQEMDLFNEVNKQFIDVNQGETLENDIKGKDGKVIAPKGSVRISTRAIGFGPGEKGINMGLGVRVRPPGAPDDGSGDVMYRARRTPGGSANGDRTSKDIDPEEMMKGIDLLDTTSRVIQPGPELEALISQLEGANLRDGGTPGAIDPGKRARDTRKAEREDQLLGLRMDTERARQHRLANPTDTPGQRGKLTRINESTVMDAEGRFIQVPDFKGPRDYEAWVRKSAMELLKGANPPEIDVEEPGRFFGTNKKSRPMTLGEVMKMIRDETQDSAPQGLGAGVSAGGGLVADDERGEYVTRGGSGRTDYSDLFGE